VRFADNWMLGFGRAHAVMTILEQVGVPSDLFHPASFGDQRPRGDNDTPEGRSLNRRVELYITRAGAAELAEEPDLVIGEQAGS